MAMRSAIRKLSKADLEELHERLRLSWYSDLDGHAEWLHEKGYSISRSSLHRHVLRLREADKEQGLEPAAIVATNRFDTKQRRRQLLERLGALRLEEHRILAQLTDIEGSGTVSLAADAEG